MIRVAFARVKPDKVERLEAWLRGLMKRQDEVRETLVQETMRHEQAFIIPGKDGPILVYAMEGEDFEKARVAMRASTLPIDLEYRQLMKEVLAERLKIEPLYDCALQGEPRATPRPGPPASGHGEAASAAAGP